MSVKSVYLVNAGNDTGWSEIVNDSVFPPLGVISIGTAVQNSFQDVEVRVFDGQVMPNEHINREIKSNNPDVVGISALSTTYRNALGHARAAKDAGAVTIFGNDQAAIFGEKILALREDIDYVCTADIGELVLPSFINHLNGKQSLQSVPEMLYRHGDGIFSTSKLETDASLDSLDRIAVPNRNLLPDSAWKQYLQNYLARYGKPLSEVTGVTTMNRARGCVRSATPCNYCGILDLSLRFSSPEMFWKDVRAGKEQVNASLFYEVCDSFDSRPEWIEQVISARPEDLALANFFVYTQASLVTARLIKRYNRLGVCHVNIGIDSGDDVMLKRLKGPHDSVEKNKHAALKLKAANIAAYGSFVLGAPGETQESLENTVNLAKWLIDENVMSAVEAQPLYPMLNAEFGRWMLSYSPARVRAIADKAGFNMNDWKLLESLPSLYGHSDCPSPNDLARDWASIFCEVDYDTLIETARDIRKYARKHRCASGGAFLEK